jgi:hypothetical protein
MTTQKTNKRREFNPNWLVPDEYQRTKSEGTHRFTG